MVYNVHNFQNMQDGLVQIIGFH